MVTTSPGYSSPVSCESSPSAPGPWGEWHLDLLDSRRGERVRLDGQALRPEHVRRPPTSHKRSPQPELAPPLTAPRGRQPALCSAPEKQRSAVAILLALHTRLPPLTGRRRHQLSDIEPCDRLGPPHICARGHPQAAPARSHPKYPCDHCPALRRAGAESPGSAPAPTRSPRSR